MTLPEVLVLLARLFVSRMQQRMDVSIITRRRRDTPFFGRYGALVSLQDIFVGVDGCRVSLERLSMQHYGLSSREHFCMIRTK